MMSAHAIHAPVTEQFVRIAPVKLDMADKWVAIRDDDRRYVI
jgi:hypothetical protein